MADPIVLICSLAGCSEQDAIVAYEETEDVVEAVDILMSRPVYASDRVLPPPQKKKRQDITPAEEEVESIRSTMKAFDSEMDKKMPNASNPPFPLVSNEMPVHREERALQNSYSQVCRLPLIEEEVQIPEIVYQLPSGRFYDSQLNGQTSPLSEREYLQHFPSPEME